MYRIFSKFNKKEWLQILICIVFVILQVWSDLKIPDYMSQITTLLQTKGAHMSEIWHVGLLMILCALLSLIASIIVGFWAARLSASISYRLRKSLYEKVESFSMTEIERFSTSSLVTRSTNDITQIQNLVAMGLQVTLKAPIMAVWAIVKISGKAWQWSLATGGAVLLLVIIVSTLIVFALPKFKVIQKLTDDLNAVTRESLIGVRVVRAYNAESFQEDRFNRTNDELTSINTYINKMMAVMMPGMSLIMNGLSLAIYWIGAYLISGTVLSLRIELFSDMIVYSSYAIQVVMSFMLLVMIFIMYPRASVAAKRINEVLDTETLIKDGTVSSKPWIMGEIEFKNVSFRYPDSHLDTLCDISFKINTGETIAIIGANGSGKSTLVNLIPRFYDVTSGEIRIDGINVKDYKLKDLRDKIGYVSQKAIIFSGSIKKNVIFSKFKNDKNEEFETKQALDIAQASEFVNAMPNDVDSKLSQNGTNLSGGQKQRISIARAIKRNPEIYIFDDSFSALDYKTDRKLRLQLNKLTMGQTKIIVSQRISTIKTSNRIIVLDEGKIVGVGVHHELLKNCPIYLQIAQSQLSKEELENET